MIANYKKIYVTTEALMDTEFITSFLKEFGSTLKIEGTKITALFGEVFPGDGYKYRPYDIAMSIGLVKDEGLLYLASVDEENSIEEVVSEELPEKILVLMPMPINPQLFMNNKNVDVCYLNFEKQFEISSKGQYEFDLKYMRVS